MENLTHNWVTAQLIHQAPLAKSVGGKSHVRGAGLRELALRLPQGHLDTECLPFAASQYFLVPEAGWILGADGSVVKEFLSYMKNLFLNVSSFRSCNSPALSYMTELPARYRFLCCKHVKMSGFCGP